MSTIPFTPKKSDERPDESTLTDRQRKVLDAIKTHLAKQGFAPSFREIGEAAGLKSPSSVKHQLQVLDGKRLHPHEREQGEGHRSGEPQ